MTDRMVSKPECQHRRVYGMLKDVRKGQPWICDMCGAEGFVSIVEKRDPVYAKLLKKKSEGGFDAR